MTDDRQQTTDLRPKTRIEPRILNGQAAAFWRVTNHSAVRLTAESRVTDKAFTLIELVVAVALLAMVISFASVIFRVSIEAYRTAGANAEIMQKLRAITDQLNADFKGQIWNPQGKVRFDFDKSYIDNKLNYTSADETKNVRSDSIIFFANGDFQSTGQYDGKTVVGNVACIFYALADVATYSSEEKPDPKKKILVRRQTILTSDSTLSGSDQLGEHYNKSLADLIADPTFDANDIMKERPELKPDNPNNLVMYMAKGVDDFSIQYVGTENPPQGKGFNEWRPKDDDVRDGWPEQLGPLALKLTFMLYESKGIIEKGRKFTHIVYLHD
jgi:prepilin-type N-terminal cleavage/methylation domain-containing protein